MLRRDFLVLSAFSIHLEEQFFLSTLRPLNPEKGFRPQSSIAIQSKKGDFFFSVDPRCKVSMININIFCEPQSFSSIKMVSNRSDLFHSPCVKRCGMTYHLGSEWVGVETFQSYPCQYHLQFLQCCIKVIFFKCELFALLEELENCGYSIQDLYNIIKIPLAALFPTLHWSQVEGGNQCHLISYFVIRCVLIQ